MIKKGPKDKVINYFEITLTELETKRFKAFGSKSIRIDIPGNIPAKMQDTQVLVSCLGAKGDWIDITERKEPKFPCGLTKSEIYSEALRNPMLGQIYLYDLLLDEAYGFGNVCSEAQMNEASFPEMFLFLENWNSDKGLSKTEQELVLMFCIEMCK